MSNPSDLPPPPPAGRPRARPPAGPPPIPDPKSLAKTIYSLLFVLDDNTYNKPLSELTKPEFKFEPARLEKIQGIYTETFTDALIKERIKERIGGLSTKITTSFSDAIKNKIAAITSKIKDLYVKHTFDGNEYTFLMSDVLIKLHKRRTSLSSKYKTDHPIIPNKYYFDKNDGMMNSLFNDKNIFNTTGDINVSVIKITNDAFAVDSVETLKTCNDDRDKARNFKKEAENAAESVRNDAENAAKNRNMDKESDITHKIKNYFIPSSKSEPGKTLATNSQGSTLWNTAIVSHMPNQSVYSTMDSVDVTLHNLFKQINDETTSSYTADGDDTQRNKYTNEANKSNEEEKNVKGVKVHTTFVLGKKKDKKVGGKKHKRTRRKNIKSKRKYTRRKTIKGGAPIKKTKGTKNIRRKISYKNKTRRYKN